MQMGKFLKNGSDFLTRWFVCRYLGELSERQTEVLAQLKAWFHEEGFVMNPWFNDTFFLKFCRARKFDLDKIKIMFKNYMDYRNEYGCDDILTVSFAFLGT